MEANSPSLRNVLDQARRSIDGALGRDRARLLGLWSRWQKVPADAQARARFEQAVAASVAACQARAAALPQVQVDPALPIAAEADRIVALIRCHVDLPLHPGTTVVLPERAANHLTRVLRLRQDDP